MDRPIKKGSGAQVGRWLWETFGRCKPRATLERACRAFGVLLRSEPLPDALSGMLLCESECQPRIVTNAAELDERQTFTALHELIHFVRNDGDQLFDGGEESLSDPIFEREAFAGAREIALPLEKAIAYRDGCKAAGTSIFYTIPP